MPRKFFTLILTVFIFMLIISPLDAREKYQLADTWGNPYGFTTASALAIDNNDNIYIVDPVKCQVRKFTPEGELICAWGGFGFKKGLFLSPEGIAIDSHDDVYVADTLNHRIQKFTSDGKFICQWGGKGEGKGKFQRPSEIVVDNSGYVYVLDSWNRRICKFTPEGKFVSLWQSWGSKSIISWFMVNVSMTQSEMEAGSLDPDRIAIDNDGYVYVKGGWLDTIYKFTPSGDFVSKCEGYEYEKLFLYKEKNGNLYRIESNKIQKFTMDEELVFEWSNKGSGDGEFSKPRSIAVNDNADVYVIDNYRVQKLTSAGEFICAWGKKGDGDGEFDSPRDITVDKNGNVYVVDSESYGAVDTGNRVNKFTSEGDFICRWGSKGDGDGEFNLPSGIAVDDYGDVYVADTWNHRICKFTLDGEFITKWGNAGSEAGQLYAPVGIAVNKDGNVYVADNENKRICKFTLDGEFVSEWKSQGLEYYSGYYLLDWIWDTGPCSIAVDNNTVYVSDSGFRQIHMFTSDGISLGKIKTSEEKRVLRLKYPYAGIAVDADRNIYAVGDENSIKIFQPVP